MLWLEALSPSKSFLGATEKDSEDFWRGTVTGELQNMLGGGFMTIQPTPLFHRTGSEDQGGMPLAQSGSTSVLSGRRAQRRRVSGLSAQLSPVMRCSHSLWAVYGMNDPDCEAEKVKVKVAQSCPTVCDPMDYIVHGLLQARILEWVAFPFSRGSSQLRDQTQVSHFAGRFFTSWATREAPLWCRD